MVVWKHVLDVETLQEIQVPESAVILYAREQSENICIWFQSDGDRSKMKRIKILTLGTGHTFDVNNQQWKHIGSAHLRGGGLIFHVFIECN